MSLEGSTSIWASTIVSELSKNRIERLYPALRRPAIFLIEEIWKRTQRRFGVTEGLRSAEKQLELYAKGRKLIDGEWNVTDKKLIVTNAKPGESFHFYGLAMDCAWAGPDPYLEKQPSHLAEQLWNLYGEVATSHGFYWGGNFKLANGAKDRPHVEMTFGLSVHELMRIHSVGGLSAVWTKLDNIRGVKPRTDWLIDREA